MFLQNNYCVNQKSDTRALLSQVVAMLDYVWLSAGNILSGWFNLFWIKAVWAPAWPARHELIKFYDMAI